MLLWNNIDLDGHSCTASIPRNSVTLPPALKVDLRSWFRYITLPRWPHWWYQSWTTLQDFKLIEASRWSNRLIGAATVCGRYLCRPEESPDRANVLSSAKTYMDITGGNVMKQEDDWIGAMEHLGLTRIFKVCKMDTEYDDMGLSASLEESIAEMMDNPHEALSMWDDVVEKQAAQTVGRRTSKLGLKRELCWEFSHGFWTGWDSSLIWS